MDTDLRLRGSGFGEGFVEEFSTTDVADSTDLGLWVGIVVFYAT